MVQTRRRIGKKKRNENKNRIRRVVIVFILCNAKINLSNASRITRYLEDISPMNRSVDGIGKNKNKNHIRRIRYNYFNAKINYVQLQKILGGSRLIISERITL